MIENLNDLTANEMTRWKIKIIYRIQLSDKNGWLYFLLNWKVWLIFTQAFHIIRMQRELSGMQGKVNMSMEYCVRKERLAPSFRVMITFLQLCCLLLFFWIYE